MRLRTFLAALPLALAACGIFDPRACTEIGCNDGLTIRLSSQPTGPYRVEIFEMAPGQGPVQVFDCAAGNCGQDIRFPDFLPGHAWVRITTEAGVRMTEFTSIVYESNRPNGPDCPPTCRQATLPVELPA